MDDVVLLLACCCCACACHLHMQERLPRMPARHDLWATLTAMTPGRQVWQALFELDFPLLGSRSRYVVTYRNVQPGQVNRHYQSPSRCGTALANLYIHYDDKGPVRHDLPPAFQSTKGGWLLRFDIVRDASLGSMHK